MPARYRVESRCLRLLPAGPRRGLGWSGAARQFGDVAGEGLRGALQCFGHGQIWRPGVGHLGDGGSDVHGSAPPSTTTCPRPPTVTPTASRFNLSVTGRQPVATGTCSARNSRRAPSKTAVAVTSTTGLRRTCCSCAPVTAVVPSSAKTPEMTWLTCGSSARASCSPRTSVVTFARTRANSCVCPSPRNRHRGQRAGLGQPVDRRRPRGRSGRPPRWTHAALLRRRPPGRRPDPARPFAGRRQRRRPGLLPRINPAPATATASAGCLGVGRGSDSALTRMVAGRREPRAVTLFT